MSQSNYMWVPCMIENAGFSSERRFEFDLPDDGGRIVGVAFVEHFRDQDKNPLQEGKPPYGQKLHGFVRCRIIRREGDNVVAELPGSDAFHVPYEALQESCRKNQ